MCSVCSPPVLRDLSQIMYRMTWKLHEELRHQRSPNFNNAHYKSHFGKQARELRQHRSIDMAVQRHSTSEQSVEHQIQSRSDLQPSLLGVLVS